MGRSGICRPFPADAVEFKTVTAQFITEATSDRLLERFDVRVGEFDDLSGLKVDEMVVVITFGVLVSCATPSEFMAVENSSFVKQFDSTVDCRHRNPRIQTGCPGVQLLHVRMAGRVLEDLGNDSALLSHANARVFATPDDSVIRHSDLFCTPPGLPKLGGSATGELPGSQVMPGSLVPPAESGVTIGMPRFHETETERTH